jgi:hypothetical protein
MGQSRGYVDVPLAPQQRKPAAQSFEDAPLQSAPPAEEQSLAGRFWDRVNPVAAAQAFGKMVIPEDAARLMGAGTEEAEQYGPINTLKSMGAATQDVFEQAYRDYQKGDYGSAAIKSMFGSILGLGPDFNQMGDNARAGEWGKVAADVAGTGVAIVAPAVAGRVRANVGKVLPAAQTAEEAAAVQLGRDRGVPIDAATATGNRYVQGMQAMADRSPLGSIVAGKSAKAQQQGMRRVAGELADEASPMPTNPVAAGEGVGKALEVKIQRHHGEATTAYDTLRKLESDPKHINRITVQPEIRSKPTSDGRPGAVLQQAITEDMPLAVDVAASKPALKPILDRLLKKKEMTGQLMGAEGRAAVALDAIVNGKDFAPLSVVDAALGDLKAMARGADMPELRTTGQGIAAEAVKQLDGQVRARAAQAGPNVLKALEDGRAATKAKYATSDARDLLVPASGEPRRVFDALTSNEDAGITKLRELRKVAPQELPNVARALLTDLFEKPLADGGFSGGQGAWSNWQRIGSDTKKLLFPKPGQTQALDSFFLLAKKLSESPNPSGTALTANSMGQTVLAFTNPSIGVPLIIGSGALSKILHTPTAVSFLTRGMRMSIDAKPGTQALAAAQLMRAAKEAGVVIPFPKAAEAEPEPRQ